MLGDVFQADTDRALDDLATRPPERPKPVAKWNGWSAPLRGLAAGAAEVGAFAADAAKGYGQIMSAGGTEKAGGMFSLQSDAEKRESELQRFKLDTQGVDTTSEAGTALRDVARDYRPDPATAGLAERLTFDLTRFLGKAFGYTVAGAGVPGAVALGSDEAMVVADDLARSGVDPATRMQAGAVAGVAAAAGVVLPVAAPGSILKTAGLWALGGPGAFVAQQAATREILAQADYGDLAAQYDPLDPVGLAVSSLVPAGFAAWAVRGALRKPGGAAPVKPGAEPPPAPPSLTPEQVDAVMTHNLTLARDVHENTPPPVPDSLPARAADRSTIPDKLPDTIPPRPVTEVDLFAARLAESEDAAVRNVGEGIKKAADVLGPEQMAAITKAADQFVAARATGDAAAKTMEALDLPPEINNLLAGIVENAHSPKRIEAMAREVMKTVQDFKTNAADVTADAVERLRSLTDEQISGEPAKPAKGSVDPLLASIEERIARVEQMVPDMVVRTDDAGQPVTVAKELARIREESRVGTDTELGAADAELVNVAANCAIGTGA